MTKDGYFYNWETGTAESDCCLNSNTNEYKRYLIYNSNKNEAITAYGILAEVMDPATITDYSSSFSLQLPSSNNQT